MPGRPLPFLALVVAVAAGAGGAQAAQSPLQTKRAEAQAVLAQVNALDVRFGRVVDSWDGARIALAAAEHRLAANAVALRRARRQSRVADRRLDQVLVAIYEQGQPTLPEIVVSASSISQLIDGIEAAQTIDAYDRRIADAARRWQRTLTATRTRLRAAERTKRTTVAALSRERRQIGTMLARRRRLLSSVQTEVAVLRQRELEHQRALAAAARARLAREAAARVAAARQAAAAAAAATATTAAPATASGTSTSSAATTTDTSTVTPVVPAPTLGAGYPEAATIALRYLGVPYQWGGASPATGFDCSGLVMYVYAQLGVQLPHQAAAQYAYGVAVPRDELQPGDLVFYDGLSHVGIYIGDGEIVHAPHTGDVVKISPLSQGGATYDGARRL